MAKLVAGVKSFKAVTLVSGPVNTTQYRTSNGRVYDTAEKANKAQTHINYRESSKRLSDFLTATGLTPANNPYVITTHALARALSNPRFAKALAAVA